MQLEIEFFANLSMFFKAKRLFSKTMSKKNSFRVLHGIFQETFFLLSIHYGSLAKKLVIHKHRDFWPYFSKGHSVIAEFFFIF